jgi:hypothetical protein
MPKYFLANLETRENLSVATKRRQAFFGRYKPLIPMRLYSLSLQSIMGATLIFLCKIKQFFLI